MVRQKPQIVEVDWGVAWRRGNIIYVNKHLKKFDPALYKHAVNHELRHKSKEGFTWDDLTNDLKDSARIKRGTGTWKFMLFHPKALVQLLPFWLFKDEDGETVLEFDINLLVMYALWIAGVVGAVFLVRWLIG